MTYSFDLTDSEIPEGIRLYSHNWGVLAGSFDQNDRGINFNGGNLSTVKSLWKDYQDYYFNCIQDSDNNLMKLIRYLQNNDMLRNTIIIFTSDHGEMHGSHGLKGKGGFIYENNIHVPLIILHPDYEGGKKIDAVTSHIDLAATLAESSRMTDINLSVTLRLMISTLQQQAGIFSQAMTFSFSTLRMIPKNG